MVDLLTHVAARECLTRKKCVSSLDSKRTHLLSMKAEDDSVNLEIWEKHVDPSES